jgi:hypothetical protein
VHTIWGLNTKSTSRLRLWHQGTKCSLERNSQERLGSGLWSRHTPPIAGAAKAGEPIPGRFIVSFDHNTTADEAIAG